MSEIPDLAAALRESVIAARARRLQREADDQPYVDPRSPAEMFRDALIAVTGEPLRYLSSIGTDEMTAALKAAGLDLTPRADR